MNDDESSALEMHLPAALAATAQAEVQKSAPLRKSIEQHFEELREPVYRYLRSCGGSTTQSEEVTQEAFVRLYKHLYRDANVPEVRPWIFRVAHNLLIDEFRKQSSSAAFDPTITERCGELYIDPTPDPEQQLLSRERTEQLRQRIATLSELQRRALYLRAEGLRYREIAVVLHLSVSTVVDAVRRAVKKLGNSLQGEAR